MRIAFLYAHPELSSFARADVEILRERHDVDVVASATTAGALRAVAAVLRCDLLFCWFGTGRFLPAVALARALGRPVIIVAGGYDVANEPQIEYGNMRGGLGRALGRAVFRLATRVLPFSESGAREAVQNAGVAASRCRVVYLGFDASRAGADVSRSAKEPLVVSVAHLGPSSIVRKGVLTTVRASRLLPDVQFVIAGRGDAETMDVLKHDAGPNVTFTGPITDSDRDALLRRASVYSQPSEHEGFGVAVAEAMLSNCVPVVSRRGSLPEVAGGHGRYVEPGDAKALAVAIRAAIAEAPIGSETPREYIMQRFPLARRRAELHDVLDAASGRALPTDSDTDETHRNRKRLEKAHYEQAAAARGGVQEGDNLRVHGARLIEPWLRAPYEAFETQVRACARRGNRVLDIGAGTGVHSLAAAADGVSLFATDIAPGALALAASRAAASGVTLPLTAADSERLPFRSGAFNVVTSAGALYCFDFASLLPEVQRVLTPDGAWVIVDSFDLNPVYRVNRLLGYARGTRTWAAVTNIPDTRTLRALRGAFESVDVRFFGAFASFAPILRPMLGGERTGRVLDRLDTLTGPPGWLSFKFVAVARGPRVPEAQ